MWCSFKTFRKLFAFKGKKMWRVDFEAFDLLSENYFCNSACLSNNNTVHKVYVHNVISLPEIPYSRQKLDTKSQLFCLRQSYEAIIYSIMSTFKTNLIMIIHSLSVHVLSEPISLWISFWMYRFGSYELYNLDLMSFWNAQDVFSRFQSLV